MGIEADCALILSEGERLALLFRQQVALLARDPQVAWPRFDYLFAALGKVAEELQIAMIESTDDTTKAYCAMLLLRLGENQGKEYLLGLIDRNDQNSAGLAATALTRFRRMEVVGPLLVQLRKYDPSLPAQDYQDRIASFISHLESLNVALPADLRSHLMSRKNCEVALRAEHFRTQG